MDKTLVSLYPFVNRELLGLLCYPHLYLPATGVINYIDHLHIFQNLVTRYYTTELKVLDIVPKQDALMGYIYTKGLLATYCYKHQ